MIAGHRHFRNDNDSPWDRRVIVSYRTLRLFNFNDFDEYSATTIDGKFWEMCHGRNVCHWRSFSDASVFSGFGKNLEAGAT